MCMYSDKKFVKKSTFNNYVSAQQSLFSTVNNLTRKYTELYIDCDEI